MNARRKENPRTISFHHFLDGFFYFLLLISANPIQSFGSNISPQHPFYFSSFFESPVLQPFVPLSIFQIENMDEGVRRVFGENKRVCSGEKGRPSTGWSGIPWNDFFYLTRPFPSSQSNTILFHPLFPSRHYLKKV